MDGMLSYGQLEYLHDKAIELNESQARELTVNDCIAEHRISKQVYPGPSEIETYRAWTNAMRLYRTYLKGTQN